MLITVFKSLNMPFDYLAANWLVERTIIRLLKQIHSELFLHNNYKISG